MERRAKWVAQLTPPLVVWSILSVEISHAVPALTAAKPGTLKSEKSSPGAVQVVPPSTVRHTLEPSPREPNAQAVLASTA